MFVKIKKILFVGLFTFLSFFSISFGINTQQDINNVDLNNSKKVNIIIFSRQDCAHCQAEKAFFDKMNIEKRSEIKVIDYDIRSLSGGQNFDKITNKFNLAKVTPITLIGDSIIVGFDGGHQIEEKIQIAQQNKLFGLSLDYYLGSKKTSVEKNGGACDDENVNECSISNIEEQPKGGKVEVVKKDTVSFFGYDINFQKFSLFSISAILGFVDGFNPCAMWVLLTFLLALSQVNSRKKMAVLAGTFIFAEAVMYYVILNVWSSAWDFIGYQEIVTKLIGILAIVMGVYFVYKYWKNRNNFTCEVTSAEHQKKVTSKITEISNKPLTFLSILAILFLAFSVNIIEFACSAGIPQTFTKILDINNLSLFKQQSYILWYTFMYMVDDLIVFALALWGYKKFYSFGAKYSSISTIVAGVLIFVLGICLVFFPNFLIF